MEWDKDLTNEILAKIEASLQPLIKRKKACGLLMRILTQPVEFDKTNAPYNRIPYKMSKMT